MSNWVHLNLKFRNHPKVFEELSNNAFPQKKPTGNYKDLISYLKEVVHSLPDLISRYFYLFEPNPHLFLALEVKDMKENNLIKERIEKIERPDFIELLDYDLNTQDENNGEAALDFFQAVTKYTFSRISKDYKTGYYNNDETKLIHCFSNQLFCNGYNEMLFSLKLLSNRGFHPEVIKQCLQIIEFPSEKINEFLYWDVKKE